MRRRYATVDVPVGRPPDEVFAFWSDPENNPRWQRGMRSCRWTSPPPVGDGSSYDQVAGFLGKEIVSSFVVRDYEPGRSITFDTTASTFPITEVRTVAPDGDGTRLHMELYGDPAKVFLLAGPLLKLLVGRSVAGDYRRLTALLESAA